MILDLKPEQQLILEPATQSGVSQERVLDQDFATIQATIEQCDCGIAIRDAFSAQIAHGFAQAERGN